MKHFVQWCQAEWPGLLDWLENGDRSLATECMAHIIVGIPLSGWGNKVSFPSDDADFAWCVELLRAVPSMVPHLGQLVRRDIRWRPWVERMRAELGP